MFGRHRSAVRLVRSDHCRLVRKDRLNRAELSAQCIRTSDHQMGTIKRSTIGIILAALSFLIYVCTVFTLPQQRDNSFLVERMSVAAAVSNIVYGARLGMLYSGAWEGLYDAIDRPLHQLFDGVSHLAALVYDGADGKAECQQCENDERQNHVDHSVEPWIGPQVWQRSENDRPAAYE